MITRWHHRISMEDMDLLSRHLTLKVLHIPAMAHMNNMVNLLHMVCIHRLPIRNLTAIPGLINLEKCHISRVQLHQLKDMVLVCRSSSSSSSNTPMHLVGKCNKLTLHMDPPLPPMDTITHKLLQLLVLGILSRYPQQLLVQDMVSLYHNNLLLMPKQPLLEVTVPTLRSLLTLNSRRQAVQAIIRHQLTKLTVVLRLQLLIAHHILDSKLMLNQLQFLLQPRLSLVMINPWLNQVVMQLYLLLLVT